MENTHVKQSTLTTSAVLLQEHPLRRFTVFILHPKASSLAYSEALSLSDSSAEALADRLPLTRDDALTLSSGRALWWLRRLRGLRELARLSLCALVDGKFRNLYVSRVYLTDFQMHNLQGLHRRGDETIFHVLLNCRIMLIQFVQHLGKVRW